MAGIAGYLNYKRSDQNLDLLDSMCQSIKYVESDVVEQWRDSHLAIGRVHHGIVNPERQPIFNEDKSLLIFMDGEVFDYKDERKYLQSRGHRFRYDNNDAEFCLHLYEEFGEKSFVKLNGSFLLAIYDQKLAKLILVNDRFSSCPLFYHENNGRLIFGAQLKAIIQSGDVPRHLDSNAILEFFTFQRILGTQTYYEDITVMFPASILKFQQGKISFKRYWEMNYQEDRNRTKEYYVEALADAIRKAVERTTNDSYHYGILMSGGLDSRTVLAASDCPITAFTIADFENNEVKIAKKISESQGCRHVFLKRDSNHYPDIIEKAVEIGDGMLSFQHAHFIGFIDRIKEECDILLHGCALGALFQGPYLPNWNFRLLNKEISFPVLSRLSESTLSQSILKKLIFSTWDKKPSQLFQKDYSKYYENRIQKKLHLILEESHEHAKKYCNRYDYFIFQVLFKHSTFLNELCIKAYEDDRRVVLDIDLFDLYLEIPPELRFRGRVLKRALKILNPTIATIPNANTGLSPMVPDYIEWGVMTGQKIIKNLRQAKLAHSSYTQGSWPKMPELIRKNNKLRQLIWDVIYDDRCINPAIFNRKALVSIFDKHLNYQDDFTSFLFLLLTFGIWHKKYGP